MIIGIPREIKAQEHRVALLPGEFVSWPGDIASWSRPTRARASAFPTAIIKMRARKLSRFPRKFFERAEIVAKVKEPLASEVPLLRRNQILFAYLHLAANRSLTEGLLASGVTSIAYEAVEKNRRLPLLEPMSEIAGRMSLLVGGYFLSRQNGGSGVLLGGVPGVLPGKVIILGGGTAGINAARMAEGLGADVTILELDLERMRFLDITLGALHGLFQRIQPRRLAA